LSYKIAITRAARRELASLPRAVQVRVAARIGDRAAEPRPPGVRKLKSERELYRIRVGDYRVVYEIDDLAPSVTVTAIGDRKESYRRHLI
jgi:mRNA interferase RelE/StbE